MCYKCSGSKENKYANNKVLPKTGKTNKPTKQMDIWKMFDEPVFVLYCCITGKLGETKNKLLKYLDARIGHVREENST